MRATPDLRAYRRIVVAFSGGKDSLAALLHLLAAGVSAHAIELHHHEVDGHGPTFMDWPCTPAYVRAIADHFGIPVYFSWREGGFARELDRDGAPTAPIRFETPEGMGSAGGNGPIGTRGLFPQTSADLRVRWCSPSLKIDVLAAAIRNQARFLNGRTLIVTGERAEESPSRAHYAAFERHRTATAAREIDHWRPVHAWTEGQVWQAIADAGIRPQAPACRDDRHRRDAAPRRLTNQTTRRSSWAGLPCATQGGSPTRAAISTISSPIPGTTTG